MIKKLLLIIPLLFSCAKHKDEDTKQPLEIIQARRDLYVSQIDDSYFVDRCDKLTFKGLYSAFGKTQDLSGHEYAPGQWHRDTRPCYPGESKSEISFDGLIAVLLDVQTSGDRQRFERTLSYGSDHGDIYGEGDRDLVYIPQLRYLESKTAGESFVNPENVDLSGFRGYLAALSVWYRARHFGNISWLEMQTLRKARSDLGEAPLLECLISRFSDGDQTKAIDILEKDFTDDIPKTTGRYSWGSSPDAVMFVLVAACLEGK